MSHAALAGFTGRLGIHGPFEGLDLDNKDPELRPLITARQMMRHSPFDRWYHTNRLATPGYSEDKLARVHAVRGPVVQAATDAGIRFVVENIEDVDPQDRRALAESFGSDAVALSVDTGHAQLARRMSGAPPVDYFVRDAGSMRSLVRPQDADGHADRHWAPGEGEIEWAAVFRALADSADAPRLVLELRDKAAIPRGFALLAGLGLVC